MTKDTHEQLDEEISRTRSGRVPKAGPSVPVEWGYDNLHVLCGVNGSFQPEFPPGPNSDMHIRACLHIDVMFTAAEPLVPHEMASPG